MPFEFGAVAEGVVVEDVLGAGGLEGGAVSGDVREKLGPFAGERGRLSGARVGELLDEAIPITHGGDPFGRKLRWGGVCCRGTLLRAEPSEGGRELALGVAQLNRDEVALGLSGDKVVVDRGFTAARRCPSSSARSRRA